MRINLALTLLILLSRTIAAKECIEKRKFIAVKGDLGMYQRVHPSGNFVMSSVGDRIKIFDLRTNPATAVDTPMKSEAYPVEGSWELIASPDHPVEGMKYFSFNEALREGRAVKAKFNDPEHDEYYHSAAEFPDSTKEKLHFRTSLYTQLKYRDYVVTQNSGDEPPRVEKSTVKSLCKETKDFSQPILSKDGLYVGGIAHSAKLKGPFSQTLQIFRIDGEKCVPVSDAGFATSKPSFAYPEKDKAPKLVFTGETLEPAFVVPISNRIGDRTAAYIFDSGTGRTVKISQPGESPQYPGFTRDGRVIYAGLQNGRKGFYVVDPGQVENGLGACVKSETSGPKIRRREVDAGDKPTTAR